MPWLVKDEDTQRRLLFVHVPRCGGTSLVKHFRVEHKARKGMNPYHSLGMMYFFYRYRLLEKANFPMLSWENIWASFLVVTAFIVYFADPEWSIAACDGSRWCPPPVSISFWVTGTFTFLMSTFVMVAPVMGRLDVVRRAHLVIFGKVLCGLGGAPAYLHGVNYDGYLMHYTAEKMLRHHFVANEDLSESFAIVRNPYSRMVSIFRYNRAGGCESFKGFVKRWRAKMRAYRQSGTTEEWDVYCHVLPMHAFTHHENRQLVPHVIRQEDLKVLKRPNGTHTDLYRARYKKLPLKVLDALRDMPHANKRSSAQPWYDMYDQETMDIVLDMYAQDFVQFGYETSIAKRPDLKPRSSLDKLLLPRPRLDGPSLATPEHSAPTGSPAKPLFTYFFGESDSASDPSTSLGSLSSASDASDSGSDADDPQQDQGQIRMLAQV